VCYNEDIGTDAAEVDPQWLRAGGEAPAQGEPRSQGSLRERRTVMKKQMYFAGMTCDKVTENTVALQISTIRPEVVPTNGSHAIWERLIMPVKRAPKGLVPLAHPYMGDYPCRVGHVDAMCGSLYPGDNYYSTDELTEKLSKAMMAPRTVDTPILAAVAIMDGRIVFKIWEPSGYLNIKMLPNREILGNSRFDFGLQTSRRAKDGVRIAYDFDNGEHCYIVEFYRGNKIYETRDIRYRPLRGGKDDTTPHFNGYMSTLTVR